MHHSPSPESTMTTIRPCSPFYTPAVASVKWHKQMYKTKLCKGMVKALSEGEICGLGCLSSVWEHWAQHSSWNGLLMRKTVPTAEFTRLLAAGLHVLGTSRISLNTRQQSEASVTTLSHLPLTCLFLPLGIKERERERDWDVANTQIFGVYSKPHTCKMCY